MNRLMSLLFILFICVISLKSYPGNSNYVQGQLIVRLYNDNDLPNLLEDFHFIRLQLVKILTRRLHTYLMSFDTNIVSSDSALLMLQRSSRVRFVQFNHYVYLRSKYPNDSNFDEQWSLHNIGQTGGKPDADIDAPEAWQFSTGGNTADGDEIVVAVVDGGFGLNHEDLDFWKNKNEIPGNQIDDDNNGYEDDYDGWNTINKNGDIPYNSHGTKVAGIIGAVGNNQKGITGVCWNIKILPIVISMDDSKESEIIEAYDYIYSMRENYNNSGGQEGAFIIAVNSSFGIDSANPSQHQVLCNMYDELGSIGILSCASAPNNNVNVDEVGDVPCGCSSDYLITVTNTDHNDLKNPYAGYGQETIDLGAPGTNILSTVGYNQYEISTGTSFSAPHVTGTLALMYATASLDLITDYKNDPSTVALQFKQWLLDSVDPLSTLEGKTVTGGRLNVYKSLLNTSDHLYFQFVNSIQGTENYGSLIIDNEFSDPVPSGEYRAFEKGTSHLVRTNELPFIPNWQGSNYCEKHHRWFERNSDYNLTHQFESDITETVQQKAIFLSTAEVIIRNQLLSISGNFGGNISIKDPWYYYQDDYGNWCQADDFFLYGSPLVLKNADTSDYGGVFLGQSPDPNDPNKPYYSVKAETQQTFTAHNQNITGYFLGWEGTNVDFEYPDQQETAVVFQADGAEARAVYKGHLASSIARATGYNNGRRICYSLGGKLHLVYEDNGEIWYTYSIDNGTTWIKEERISPKKYVDNYGITHVFVHPAIAAYGPDIFVVWENKLTKYSTVDNYISYRSNESGNWSIIETVSNGSLQNGWWTGNDDQYPTIAAGADGVFIAYLSVTEQNNKFICIRRKEASQWTPVGQSSGSGKPSIDLLPGTPYQIAMVWAQDNTIKYRAFYWDEDREDWRWSAMQEISNVLPWFFDDHNNPSLATDGNYGYVSWETFDTQMEEKHVFYQKYQMGASATAVGSAYSLGFVIDNNDIGNSSISFDNSNNYVTIFYEYQGDIMRKRSTGSSWYAYNYGSGKYPSICPNKSTGTVWTTYTSAPYLLKTENPNGWLAKSALAEVASFKRFYYSRSDSGYYTVDLKKFTANGQALTFYQNLNSDTIAINGLTDFDYQLEMGENIEAGDLLSFWFVTDEQKYFLDAVQLDGNEAQTVIERSLSFDPGQPVKGYVQIEFSDNEPFVINVVPDNGNGSLAKNVTLQSASFVPQRFALKQNFPNPFNPVTQIQFDLPQAAKVTLKVFDLSGHEVSTLVDGYRSAGRYQLVFDGSNLASGVYIYRLTTNKGFTQSRKMMLIK